MDEPASALDPAATLRFEELVHELARRYTVLIVTHNMQQAARVSDYTAFLHEGRLIEFGETDALLTNPRERLTEDYITREICVTDADGFPPSFPRKRESMSIVDARKNGFPLSRE